MGRSIGTGVALELLKKAKPGALPGQSLREREVPGKGIRGVPRPAGRKGGLRQQREHPGRQLPHLLPPRLEGPDHFPREYQAPCE